MSSQRPLTVLIVDDSDSKQRAALTAVERWAQVPQTNEALSISARISRIQRETNQRVSVIIENDPFRAKGALAAIKGEVNVLITDNMMLGEPFAKEILEAASAVGVPHQMVYTRNRIPGLDAHQVLRIDDGRDASSIQAWLQTELGSYELSAQAA